eukprot:TRINITY_DN73884_c0_g1_i1.p1 TRINITY_DN73884_c0_g1~~TRINITY_DN73884_c0_g1_i1.p1  ORF type:complete len:103 (+),score=13.55 TRINITY_DN73884_c0_g1_i1:162-470(+)
MPLVLEPPQPSLTIMLGKSPVVDTVFCKTSAGTGAAFVDIEAECTNVDYKPAFDRLPALLATHDWRPWEWNVTADRLCNIALDSEESFRHDFGIGLQGAGAL